MAQLVERVLGKDEVTGSNPVSSSIKQAHHYGGELVFYFAKKGVLAFNGGNINRVKKIKSYMLQFLQKCVILFAKENKYGRLYYRGKWPSGDFCGVDVESQRH